MSTNFSFLAEKYPSLERFGEDAENTMYSAPAESIVSAGKLCRSMMRSIYEFNKQPAEEGIPQDELIAGLSEFGNVPDYVSDAFTVVEASCRDAEENAESKRSGDAKTVLQLTHMLCSWFMLTFVNMKWQPQDFRIPE